MHPQLILLRHGQSVWNQKNLFTGWVDIPLNQKGIEEALAAGKKIASCPIDVVYTSTLIRAQMSVPLALLHHQSGKIPVFLHPGEGKREEWGQVYSEEAKKQLIPVYTAWELNERMYGHLQGLNKAETAAKFGAEQVQVWRRSFEGEPPKGESLAMTARRAVPYFEKEILPRLQRRETVLIVAHGNSLRAIIMYLEGLSPEEVVQLELATGDPLLFSCRQGKWQQI